MTTMTAAMLVAHGGPEALEVRDDVPVPRPGPGAVRIRVTAAGVNNTDLWTREGAYGAPDDPDAIAGWQGVPITFPRIQGGDAVGEVVELGQGVEADLLGRRVLVDPISYGAGHGDAEPTIDGVMGSEEDGAFAEYLCVDADRVHDVTDSPLSDVQLACLPIAYGTAMGMLDRAAVRSGERILVTGGSGGVGLALVALAAALGAEVVAVSRARHVPEVEAAGADEVLARDGTPLREQLEHSGPFDAVADVVGGIGFGALLASLRPGGRLVTCGAVAGPRVELDLRVLYLQRLQLIGSTMHTPAQFRRLVELARTARLSPRVARRFPLTEIAEAQRAFRAGSDVGKLVLRPDG